MRLSRKKAVPVFLVVIVFAVIIIGGYLARNNKSAKTSSGEENLSAVSQTGETFWGRLKEEKETTGEQAQISGENRNEGDSTLQNPVSENKDTAKVQQDEKEILPAEIGIVIVKRGAPAVSAEEIRNLLKKSGYAKTTIADEKGASIVQTLIFFREEKFRKEAQTLRELLIQKEKIYSALHPASTVEERSADIVIVLGKNKEAPPN